MKDVTVYDLAQETGVVIGELSKPQAVAQTLLLLAHDNRDRSVWGGQRALEYWDRLPDKVRMATYSGPTLAHWWERMVRLLGVSHPRSEADRTELATALACGLDADVLTGLRTQTEMLCLRARIAYTQIRPMLTEGEMTP